MKIVVESRLEVGDRVVAVFSHRTGTIKEAKAVNLPSYNPRWDRTDSWMIEYQVEWDGAPSGQREQRYLVDLMLLADFLPSEEEAK